MNKDVQSRVEDALHARIWKIDRELLGKNAQVWQIDFKDLGCGVVFDPVTHEGKLLTSDENLETILASFATRPAAYIDDPYAFPFITTIEYFSTEACNAACSYCYLGKLPSRVASADRDPTAAINRIERLFACDQIGPELSLLLIGGEPLLAFDGVKKLVSRTQDLADQYGSSLKLHLTTNGTLISDHVADWLKQNEFGVSVSFDGRFQAVNRPFKGNGRQTYDIKTTLAQLEGHEVTIRATLLPDQYSNQGELFLQLAALGAKRIQIGGVHGKKPQLSDVVEMAEGILDLYAVCESAGFFELQLEAAFDSLRFEHLARSHCAAGKGHVVLDSKGELKPCANFDLIKGVSPLIYNVDDDQVCGRCALRYMCNATGGGCRAWRGLNGSSDPDPVECAGSATRLLLAIRRAVSDASRSKSNSCISKQSN